MKRIHLLLSVVFLTLVVSIFWIIKKNDTPHDNNLSGQAASSVSSASATASSASRDNSSSSPVLLEETFDRSLYKAINYSEQPATTDSSRAYVRVPSTSSRVRLMPNQFGEFPTQAARHLETIAVRMEISDAKPGTPVAVTIMDGGSFPGETADNASRLITVEEWGGVSFQFTTSPNDGHHRLRILPSGGRLKILDFYATMNSSTQNL